MKTKNITKRSTFIPKIYCFRPGRILIFDSRKLALRLQFKRQPYNV